MVLHSCHFVPEILCFIRSVLNRFINNVGSNMVWGDNACLPTPNTNIRMDSDDALLMQHRMGLPNHPRDFVPGTLCYIFVNRAVSAVSNIRRVSIPTVVPALCIL